ncbi:MAG: hypothetical protein AB8G05_10370 [Oligoflexales bacterium]
MGKVIKFPEDKCKPSEAMKLKQVSDAIDSVLIDALESKGLAPHELAGLLAHRLGSFMRPMDSKSDLWDICEKVLKRQAVLD